MLGLGVEATSQYVVERQNQSINETLVPHYGLQRVKSRLRSSLKSLLKHDIVNYNKKLFDLTNMLAQYYLKVSSVAVL
jgi:hypothetical protein